MIAALALVAGCFKPSTDSCKYQCATEGTPCPSGLECIAGRCAEPGTTCPAAPSDEAGCPGGCGDGCVTAGELCVGLPIVRENLTTALDGQLVDVDNDGAKDLVFATDTGVMQITQVAGGFPGLPALLMNIAARAFAPTPDPITSRPLFVIAASTTIELWRVELGSYLRGSSLNLGASDPLGLRLGSITGPATTDASILFGSVLRTFHIDVASRTISIAANSDAPLMGASAHAIAEINGDDYDDVAVVDNSSLLKVMPGAAGKLDVNGRTDIGVTDAYGVAIGDFNGDGLRDLAFTTNPQGQPTLGYLLREPAGIFGSTRSTGSLVVAAAPVAVADLDGDGRDDVIVQGTTTNVLIFRGTPAGLESTPVIVNLPVEVHAQTLHVDASYNHDDIPDIVMTDGVNGRIVIVPTNP